MQDVKDAALSAVDAAIEQGYADPNRLDSAPLGRTVNQMNAP